MAFLLRFDELSALFPDAVVKGSARPDITGVQSIEQAGPGEATFATGVHAGELVSSSRASVIFVPKALAAEPAEGQAFLGVDNPAFAVSRVAGIVEAFLRPRPAPGVHPSAVVEADACVSPLASIGPFCHIGPGASVGEGSVLEAGVKLGRGASVGKNCLFHQNVVLSELCRVGDRSILHAGAIVGSDGFGFLQVGRLPNVTHFKIPQVGIVVIGSDVEIGANTTIDRARFGETRVGDGTKIDNLVQIGHNCIIGRCCVICSMVGLSGSTTLGDYVVMWGQSATAGHLTIGDFAFIGGKAGVTKDISKGAKVTGTPARNLFEVRKADAALVQLPELLPALKKLVGKNAPSGDDEAGS